MPDQVYFHIVFTVWRGRTVLQGDVEAYFHELVTEICHKRQYSLMAMETMPNHVHMLIAKPPWEDISEIVKNVKGATSRYIFQRFPYLRGDMGSEHVWTRGFEYVKHSDASLPTVIAYIKNQKTKNEHKSDHADSNVKP
jgi:putative transposase